MNTITTARTMELHRLIDGATKSLLGWLLPGQQPEALDYLTKASDALRRPDIVEGTVCRCGEAFLTLIRWDLNDDGESWSWYAVIAVQGPLPDEEGGWDEQAILTAMREGFGIHCAIESESGAGRPFAESPWIQFIGTRSTDAHPVVRTLIVSQRGGLDV